MSENALRVDIPNEANWPVKSIGSLCTLISRGTAPVYVEHSDVLAIGQRCVSNTNFVPELARPHSHRAMRNVLCPESGDVLLNSTGTGTIGRSVVFNDQGRFIVDGHVTVMRPRLDVAGGPWLNSVLRTAWLQNHLERFCYSGSTNQLELTRTPLSESHLPVPSLEEQKRISQVLDTLDTAIHETEAIIAKLKAVKQGLLHDLLTRGIDANGELRPPQAEAPHLYKQSPLGWIPKEWEAVSIYELATNLDGRRVPIKEGFRKSGGFPYYGASGVIDWVDSYLFDGDYVLLGEDGENVVSRRLPLAFRATGKIWVNNHAHIFQPKTGVDIRFLTELMEAKDYGPWISGSAQPKITQEAISRIRFVKPPSSEQVEIGHRLEVLANRIQHEERELSKLLSSKTGLMDDLLTGRVRVTPLLEAERQKEYA
jgi:type I restriction enzyme S subunit